MKALVHGLQCDSGAEGVAGKRDASSVNLRQLAQIREGGSDVVLFTDTVVVASFAAAGAAKVEAKCDDAVRGRRLANGVDNVVVHIAAVHRVRVTDDDPGSRRSLRQI